jgi:hypothetical protein
MTVFPESAQRLSGIHGMEGAEGCVPRSGSMDPGSSLRFGREDSLV